MAQYSEPSNSRKTFVLRCDRPRYDGGVEVDLERYFGRRLQPSQQTIRQARQQLEQIEALKQEARRLLAERLPLVNQVDDDALLEDVLTETEALVEQTEAVLPETVCLEQMDTRSEWQAVSTGVSHMASGLLGLGLGGLTLMGCACLQLTALMMPAYLMSCHSLHALRRGLSETWGSVYKLVL